MTVYINGVEQVDKQVTRDFWSEVADKITINDDDPSVADVVFPSVTIPVPAIPADLTIARVVAMLKVRAIMDTSGADNYIEDASRSIRVLKDDGEAAWGVDDKIAINFDQNQWYVVASQKEGGDIIIGTEDIKAKVDEAETYFFESHQSDGRNDAIHAKADSLELYDVQMGLRFYLET